MTAADAESTPRPSARSSALSRSREIRSPFFPRSISSLSFSLFLSLSRCFLFCSNPSRECANRNRTATRSLPSRLNFRSRHLCSSLSCARDFSLEYITRIYTHGLPKSVCIKCLVSNITRGCVRLKTRYRRKKNDTTLYTRRFSSTRGQTRERRVLFLSVSLSPSF